MHVNLTTLRRVAHRLKQHSVVSLLLGLVVRPRFNRSGILVQVPGWPLVQVINHGGWVEAENCTFFPGVRLECLPEGYIHIGNGTYLNRRTEIIAAQRVTIGRDCLISWDVVIMDTDQHGHHGKPAETRPVIIGDRVWIGCRAIILKGVIIGDDAVIGAGAIVTKSVPAGAIAVGEAAHILPTRP